MARSNTLRSSATLNGHPRLAFGGITAVLVLNQMLNANTATLPIRIFTFVEYSSAPTIPPPRPRWTRSERKAKRRPEAKIPAPPFNYPTVTDSGGAVIIPHMTAEGQLFFFATDRRTVHIAFGEPVVTEGWTCIEDANCHLDPHGLALTPDFHPWSPDVEVPGFGRALLVNDGGINFSTNGVQSWSNGRGLSTLGIVNIAVNTVPARPAAICLGCGDNFGFASPDGGATWKTQNYLGGDNDCAFADPCQPNRMVVFAPRSKSTPPAADNVFGKIYLYVSGDGSPPDTALGTSVCSESQALRRSQAISGQAGMLSAISSTGATAR